MLVEVVFSDPHSPCAPSKARVVVPGFTDSMNSSLAVAWGVSTSFPLGVVCMELAAQCESANVLLELAWTPCGFNAEVDALSKHD